MRRRRGFTLIELLVVIAIIAILAAMLFPVFARARESARKIQCLSNVKNIAMAVQIYLTDFDRFPPSEHRQDVHDYLVDVLGEGDCTCRTWLQNPYVRWMVVFDEYVKNRDVWRCPSARRLPEYMINPCVPDWFTALKNGPTECNSSIQGDAFPPGWGGTITDSYKQRDICAGPETGGIEIGIAVESWYNQDIKTSEINDSTKRVVCSDGGGSQIEICRTSWVAYPDICGLDCGLCDSPRGDWVNCDWTQDCAAWDPRFFTDPNYRKEHARPRHLGGSNLGFADGHAAWMNSEAILFGGDLVNAQGKPNRLLEGLEVCGSFFP